MRIRSRLVPLVRKSSLTTPVGVSRFNLLLPRSQISKFAAASQQRPAGDEKRHDRAGREAEGMAATGTAAEAADEMDEACEERDEAVDGRPELETGRAVEGREEEEDENGVDRGWVEASNSSSKLSSISSSPSFASPSMIEPACISPPPPAYRTCLPALTPVMALSCKNTLRKM